MAQETRTVMVSRMHVWHIIIRWVILFQCKVLDSLLPPLIHLLTLLQLAADLLRTKPNVVVVDLFDAVTEFCGEGFITVSALQFTRSKWLTL